MQNGIPETVDPIMQSPTISYLKDTQSTLMRLEASLRNTEDSKEIIRGTLKAAARFYGADRACVLEADCDLHIAINTYEWDTSEAAQERAHQQYIPFEYVPCLENALQTNQPLVIASVEDLIEEYPEEYRFLKKQGTQSMIAAPYSKRLNTGLIIVENPKKYGKDPSFLLLLSYVIVLELNEIKLQHSLDLAGRKISNQCSTEVMINMFGGLEIISAQGILRDSDFTSDQGCNLLTYLLFSRGSVQPVHRLCEINRLDDDVDDPYSTVKGVVYRLRNTLSLIGLQDLIQVMHGTFVLNPKYTIHTDVDRFDELCARIAQTSKMDVLKGQYARLMEIYKGSLLPWYDYFPWLMPKVRYYQNKYLEKLKSYIKLLNRMKDHLEVQRIATEALSVCMHDNDFLFYSIMADLDLGNRVLAKRQYKQAESYLTDDQKAQINQRLQ